MIKIIPIVTGIILLSGSIWNSTQADLKDRDKEMKTILSKKSEENHVELKPNIVYSKKNGKALNLHLLLPKNSAKPSPLIIFIKGGGWGKDHPQKTFAFMPQLVPFAKNGYVVASVEHRTSREAKFPAQLYDIKTAVRYLKENAAKYDIDPERIGVWGSSSGGHLAALVGTSGGVAKLEENEGNPSRTDSHVQAVVDWYGPTDFSQMSKFPLKIDVDAPDSPESTLIGGPVQENQDKVKLANPITYVTPDDPPFLIMHGDKDRRVPFNQSVLIYQALQKAKVEVTMYKIKGAGHGGFSQPAILNIVQEFFDRHLKNR